MGLIPSNCAADKYDNLEIWIRGWHKGRRRRTISHCMVRFKASVLMLALLASPVASLCGTRWGAFSKCPPLCPMHRETRTTAEETDGMECHHGRSAKQHCVMKSGCGHTPELGLVSAIPPAVLCAVVELMASGANGTIRLAATTPSLAGFKTPPLQPPRA